MMARSLLSLLLASAIHVPIAEGNAGGTTPVGAYGLSCSSALTSVLFSG